MSRACKDYSRLPKGMLRRVLTRTVLFLAVFAFPFIVKADIVSNCFRVVNYSPCWHVECTLDGFTNALYIAIDDNAHNGFRAGDHGSRAYTYLAAVESSETIDAGTFIGLASMVEFIDQSDFIVAFAIGCSECNRIDGNFGWVRLAYEGGTIVLKGGAIDTTQGSPLVVEGVLPSFVNPETGCETNTFYTTRENPPRILHHRDVAFDFVIFNYTEHCWGVGVQHSRGNGYVATVSAGTYVSDSTFSQQKEHDGYDSGDLFFLAFKWIPDANDTTRRTRYGWMAIGLRDGVPAVLASEMSETAGAPLVARGFEGVDDGPDDPVEGLIWRCNFNGGVQMMNATNMPEVASHMMLTGSLIEALIDDGRYSGRRCVEIGGSYGERAWFSVNEKVDGGLGPRYIPGKWQTLKTSFKMYSFRAWEEQDGGLYAEMPPSPEEENARGIKLILAPGTIVNIDDKIALRYCECEDEFDCDMDYWWEVNAGMTNGVGELEARTVRLVEKERGDEPTSPIKNWVTVEIEAVNDGSPHGLAYRIYIDGILACSKVDGSTVFRARPEALDRTGVTALGIGGDACIDDVVFSSTTIDPLSGIEIYPQQFGAGNVELTDDELDNLAGIVGFEALSTAERITMYPWEDDSGCEPLDAPKMCIDLGISPYHRKPDDGREVTMFFKYPAVRAIGIDPSSRTVTGQIVPAEGTRIVQPPLRFMFGIKHHMDFGTPCAHAEEYGYDMYQYPDKFTVDTSNYTTSNGLFTVTYDEKFSEDDSAFFSLTIKDFRYWW